MMYDISHIIMMGDSLSDRGTAYHRYILGFIPMRWLTGLEGVSPEGRFTNGLVWTDHLAASLASEFTIDKFIRDEHFDASDISDAVIDHDPKIENQVHHYYDLNNDLYVKYRGRNFVRNYDEGGLTSHSYKGMPSKSISRYFKRLFLSTLEEKRNNLLAYDKQHHISNAEKSKTLIIEWSGANDLITVNEKPSKCEVDQAIKDRIKNIRELIKNGYRHFVLFNLPDLSLTPRYQAKSEDEQLIAKKYSIYFNEQLKIESEKLQSEYPDCNIDIFDAYSEFQDLYNNPEKYNLDKDKRNLSYIKSPDFKINSNRTSPSTGYMFWDDIHPTADVHAILAETFCDKYRFKYSFIAPKIKFENNQNEFSEEQLCHLFHKKFYEKLEKDKSSLFGRFAHSNSNSKHIHRMMPLRDILKQALYEEDKHVCEIMSDLGWMDHKGNLNMTLSAIKAAKDDLDLEVESSSRHYDMLN